MASTKKQGEVALMVKTEEFKKVVEYLENIRSCAKDAIIKLPHKNEHGESVLHRDNLRMHGISGILGEAIYELNRFID